MAYKPMDERVYRRFLRIVGWRLEKGGIDYNLFDEKDVWLCAIKISHGKKSDKGVVASSVRKTENLFKKRGWKWPPEKK